MKVKAKDIIKNFKDMPWEVWLRRRFHPFVTYLMMKAGTRAAFRTQGIDSQYPIALYDTDDWYETPEMFDLGAKEAERYLKQKNIFQLVKQCEDTLARGKKEIPLLCQSSADPLAVFKQFLVLFEPANVFIWVAHGSEPYYHRRIREAVRAFVPPKEVETFIGDASFPSKKNALARMEDAIRGGDLSVAELHQKYAWIKSRGGFLPGYTLEEMGELQTDILSRKMEDAHERPKIPVDLEGLVAELQELVYLRTLRTDALYEMLYLAMPLLDRFAKSVSIDSVKNYISDDLLVGHVEQIPRTYAILKYYDDVVVHKESIMTQRTVQAQEVSGVIAHKGFAKGVVRILHLAADIAKVRDGDILITNMTNPSYIIAMRRAAAFVTDEGGITCHAAIIARELHKPCIIGTKIATKVFKDGDRIEVDATKGIVRKLS